EGRAGGGAAATGPAGGWIIRGAGAAPAAALRSTRDVLRISANLFAITAHHRPAPRGARSYETFWAEVRLVSSVRKSIPARANRGPETQRGGRWAAPLGYTATLTSGQFGTAPLPSARHAPL